jgi:DNA-directed RNA polymerase specialized sigma24 family protein
MRSPETFDAFYAETRDRLLREAYALTGDLAASRIAVRDAFSDAWHHWRKVSRLEDREGFVRPIAHRRAQRRHAAHPWHREKGISDDVRATLDALSKLSAQERKTLVLTTLSPMSLGDIAREVGLPQSDAERVLQSATSRFAVARGVASTGVRPLLEDLLHPIADTRWPRSTIVRRAGTVRRRTHTLIGSGAAVAALLISGTVVASDGVEPSTLDQESALPSVTLREPKPAGPASLGADSLLVADQVSRFGAGLKWREDETSDNLAGDGLVMPCQQDRFADPAGSGALMRSFTGTTTARAERKAKRKGKARTPSSNARRPARERATAIEFVEMSADPKAARAAYATARGWYAGCLDSRAQLLSTHKISRVGDEATVLTLRTWNKTPAEIAVGLARTGRLTVITLVRSTSKPVPVRAAATGLAAAVNAACGKTGAGACAGPPKMRPRAPIATGKPPGLLNPVDLPPVAGAVGPWVGTDPARPRLNFAATRCDNTQFTGRGLKHALTRTFLFPAKRRVDTFGLTQTVATMKARQAAAFVAEVRSRIRACGGANTGTTVDTLVNRSGRQTEMTVWDLAIEISDERTMHFWMAIMRDGKAVSQVGFTPDEGMTLQREAFIATAERALERLSDLPSA